MKRIAILGLTCILTFGLAESSSAQCGGGAGLFGLFKGRAARQQAAMQGAACNSATGECSSSGYSAYTYTTHAPASYVTYQTAPLVQAAPQAYAYAVQPTPQAPAKSLPISRGGASCDANGDGCCDHCGQKCTPSTLAPAPPSVSPPIPPPATRNENPKDEDVKFTFYVPDPQAPPIVYSPAPRTSLVATR